MPLGDLAPVGHARAAERVGADAHPRVADRVEVEHLRQVVDVGAEEVVGADGRARLGEGHPSHARDVAADQLVGAGGDDARRVGVGRPAVRRVVLEAAVLGRVVRRGDHDPVGEARARRTPLVGADDRVADRGSGREPVAVVDQHGHVVGDQHLERRGPGRLGEGVGVAPDEERAVVALLRAVVADRLGRRGDVDLVEGRVERRAAVPARAEGDLLRDVVGVGLEVEVGRDQVGDVHQVLGAGGLSGSLVGGHGPHLGGSGNSRRERCGSGVDSGRVGPSEW